PRPPPRSCVFPLAAPLPHRRLHPFPTRRSSDLIFENIRAFVLYLLSCNLSEILVIGLAAAVGYPLPLLPLQILFLNLVTDVFPADRKSTRLNSSHVKTSYAAFCLTKQRASALVQ